MAIRSLPISLALSLNSLDPDHQCADTRGINPAAQTKDEPGATVETYYSDWERALLRA
jgi:hypothetical protein